MTHLHAITFKWRAKALIAQKFAEGAGERRAHRRLWASVDLQIAVTSGAYAGRRSPGRTVNLSSGGVLVQSALPLLPGSEVELCVDWPGGNGSSPGYAFYAIGRTVRRQGETAAIRILRFDCRAQHPPRHPGNA
jgi:hypothetical protein